MVASSTGNEISQEQAAVERFPSLAVLRLAHRELMERHRLARDGAEEQPGLVAEMERLIVQGRATGALLDGEDDRWAAQGVLDYWNSLLYREGHEPPDATLAEYDAALAPELADEDCPYLGLEAFGEVQAERFHGRNRLIQQLIRKLEQQHLLAVVGCSGSGKSSVVRGGLVPQLKAGKLPGSEDWVYFSHLVPGSQPLDSLVQRLCPLRDAEKAVAWQVKQLKLLRQDPAHLARLLTDLSNGQPAVVVVDQFEELFTLCRDEVEQQCFCDALLAAVEWQEPSHRVILTLRTDFEPRVTKLEQFKVVFDQGQIRVRAMDAGELREAIESPAEQVGLRFEQGLVDELLEDVLGEPAALPLLQFSLLKLWDGREKNRVTWETYHRLGGGRLALASSADAFYQRLIPEDQAAARRILLKMVWPTEGLEIMSGRVRRAALYAGGEAQERMGRVLKKLVDERLVRLTEGGKPEDDQMEVAHEALIRNWPTLMDWLEDERVTLRQRLRLTAAAQDWHRCNRDKRMLWRGSILTEAQSYQDLSEVESKFLQQSVFSESQEKKKKKLLTATAIIFLLSGLISTCGALLLTGKLFRDEQLQSKNLRQKNKELEEQKEEIRQQKVEISSRNRELQNAIEVLQAKQSTIEALTEESNINPIDDISKILIEYYPKIKDSSIIDGNLKEDLKSQGFTFITKPISYNLLYSNEVSFGDEVPIDAVKLVSKKLVNQGANIQIIEPFKSETNDFLESLAYKIQIGTDSDTTDAKRPGCPTWSVEEIEQTKEFRGCVSDSR